ncbi:putative ribonuclease H-like domain-containing protein [Tanacetum coccineum]
MIFVNNLKTHSENDNEKAGVPSFPSPKPTTSYVDDLDFYKDFENEYPVIIYNYAQMSKSDYLTKQTLSPQHNNESDLKDETSLSKYDEVGQNVLYFNDLFSFNVIHPDDLKSDEDNDNNEIDVIQSSQGSEITHGSNVLSETSHDKINKTSRTGSFVINLNANIVIWNYYTNRMLFYLIMNLYVPFGVPFNPKRYYKNVNCAIMLQRPSQQNSPIRRMLGLKRLQGFLELLLLSAAGIDQGLGSTSGIRAFALRNFDVDVMEFESAHGNTTAKLPILKLGEYEMWVIRIKQYFQIQDYALWEVIENGNSWVSVPQIAQENGTSVTKMSVPVTAEEKTNKKNDVKARSLLLMALPNEHQLTFSQYTDAKTMFAAIETQFGGVVIVQEDLNSKFLNSLPPEWNTHVVVWMNKAENETMSIDDLYNNFKIIKQIVKKSVGASSGAQNLAFMTALSTSSTNDFNTAIHAYEVSTASPNINVVSPHVITASFSDNAVYAFMIENPNGSNLLQQDLEQIHEDYLEAIDLKWQLSLLSMRVKRYYQRTCKKFLINANDTAGYDKSKVECFNFHKMGHFARECRAPRNKEGQFRNQDNTRKQGNNKDTSSKEMLAIDGVGFYWSDMAEEQVQTNMALMAFSDSKVYTDKTCSKICLKNYETLKKQCDDLIVKLNQTEFTTAIYKRGLATVEEQLIAYKKNEVLFSEEVTFLKREVACKDYEINMLKSEFEKVKQEKEGIEFKIKKFNKASKDLDKLLESQIYDKSKKGLGYSAVPPPYPLIYNRPKKLDLSYSGLDEFKDPESKVMVLRIVSKSLMLFV